MVASTSPKRPNAMKIERKMLLNWRDNDRSEKLNLSWRLSEKPINPKRRSLHRLRNGKSKPSSAESSTVASFITWSSSKAGTSPNGSLRPMWLVASRSSRSLKWWKTSVWQKLPKSRGFKRKAFGKWKKSLIFGPSRYVDSPAWFQCFNKVSIWCCQSGKREFLVRWVGCRPDEDTWEPEDNLDCPELVEKFLKTYQSVHAVDDKSLRIFRKPVQRLAFASRSARAPTSRHGSFRWRYNHTQCRMHSCSFLSLSEKPMRAWTTKRLFGLFFNM